MKLTKKEILENKKVLKEDTLENILMIAGFVPVIGEIADIILIIRYIYKKEYLYAALMLVALIPTVGDFIVKPFIRVLKGMEQKGLYNKPEYRERMQEELDIIISLARGRKDKVNGSGNWHFIKNRYGADGLTFGSKINTANGYIDIYDQPLDDEAFETNSKGNNKQTNQFSEVGVEDRYVLRSKFAKSKGSTRWFSGFVKEAFKLLSFS